MKKLEFRNIMSVLDHYDVLIFDLWGVIVEGDYIYPGVVDTINNILSLKQVYFASNAPRPIFGSFKKIESWGIKASLDNVVTSGEIARQLITNSKTEFGIDKPIIYHLGAERNNEILVGINAKTTTNIKEANILLLTLYRDQGENLEEFDQILAEIANQNIVNICANPDTIIKLNDSLRYTSGYFAAKLEALDRKVIYTGKPHTPIFDLTLSKVTNVPKNRILMVGDTLETDILGASKVGIHSALVMTGNAEKFHIAHSNMETKLAKLEEAAIHANIMPNFITSLT